MRFTCVGNKEDAFVPNQHHVVIYVNDSEYSSKFQLVVFSLTKAFEVFAVYANAIHLTTP